MEISEIIILVLQLSVIAIFFYVLAEIVYFIYKDKREKKTVETSESAISDLNSKETQELKDYIRSIKEDYYDFEELEKRERKYREYYISESDKYNFIDIKPVLPYFKSDNIITEYHGLKSNSTYEEYKMYFNNGVKELNIDSLNKVIEKSEKELVKIRKKIAKTKKFSKIIVLCDLELKGATLVECAKAELKKKNDYNYYNYRLRMPIGGMPVSNSSYSTVISPTYADFMRKVM